MLIALLLLTGARQEAGLAADARLAASIEIRADALAAPELCSRLSMATGAPLAADAKLSNDLVIVYAKDRPAREVMDKVAEHFHWEWAKRGDGYILKPTADYAQYELNRRREQVLARWSPMLEDARANARRFSALTPTKAIADSIRAIKEQIADEEKNPPSGEFEGGSSMPVARWNRIALADPFARLAAVTVASLSDSQILELDRRPLVFSTRPKPLQQQLPSAARSLALTLPSQIEQTRSLAGRMLAKEAAAVGQRMPSSQWEFDPAAIATVRLSMAEPGGCAITLLDGMGAVLYRQSGGGLNDEALDNPDTWQKRADDERRRSRFTGPPIDAEFLSRSLDHKGALAKAYTDAMELLNSSSTLAGLRILVRQGLDTEPLARPASYLNDLAAVGGFSLVSDCYDDQLVGAESEAMGTTPRKALEQWAYYVGSHWSCRDGWVLIRSDRWAAIRPSQLPREVLGAAGALRLRQHDLTVDQRADFSAKLGLAQIETRLWELVTWAPRTVDGSRILRFWGSLDPALREQLRSGRTVSVSQLRDESRQRLIDWLIVVQQRGEPWASPPNSVQREPEFEEDPPGRFEERQRIDTEITERSLAEIGAATLEVRHLGLPVMTTTFDEELKIVGAVWSPWLLASATIAPTGHLKAESADLLEGKPRHMIHDVCRIRVTIPGLQPVTTFLDGLRDMGPAEFDARKWPPDLRRRVEAAWNRKALLH